MTMAKNNTSKLNLDALNEIAASVSKTANEVIGETSALTFDDSDLGVGDNNEQKAEETVHEEVSQEPSQKEGLKTGKRSSKKTGITDTAGAESSFEEKLSGMSPKVANLLREITRKNDKNKSRNDKNYIHIGGEVWPYIQKIKNASGATYEMIVTNMIVHVLRQCQEEVWNLDKDEAKPVL